MASVAEEIATLRGTRPAKLRDLLTHPSFSRLWRAMLVSSLGDWVGFVAVASLVARLGGARLGGLAVAGVMLARLLPSVLFGPFAGVLVDRLDRRKVMVGADVARGILYASMPFMPGLWAIFLLSFCIECLALLWVPAKDSSIPNIVPRRQLANANSISLITAYGTLPLGAVIYTALAGMAAGVGTRVTYFHNQPEFLALWLDSLTFFFSARMVWGLSLPPGPAVARGDGGVDAARLTLRTAWADLKQGIRFLRGDQVVRTLTLGIVMAFGAAGCVVALGPIFARYTLNAPATGFGLLMISLGVGMGLGMASMSHVTRVLPKENLFPAALLAAGACLMLIAVMPTITLACLFTIPMGAAAGLAWVTGYTLLQENVSDDYRGRTFGTLTTLGRLALFAALAGFPIAATAIGLHTVTIGNTVWDLSGTRITLWMGAGLALFAGFATRQGLKRSRLTKPHPLTIVPRFLKGERPGLFIVFEGVEGAGKGTQIELARAYLESRDREVVLARDPGGTSFGDRLRQTVLDPRTGLLDVRAEALVFAASRAHLAATVIRPALAEGKVVLCDRFIDSSVAYQGVARGLGEQDILTLNAWATQGLFPDLVLLLRLEPETALSRIDRDPDRIESEGVAFHAKVAQAYLDIAEDHPERFCVVDATGTREEVHERVRVELDRLLSRDEPGRSGPT